MVPLRNPVLPVMMMSLIAGLLLTVAAETSPSQAADLAEPTAIVEQIRGLAFRFPVAQQTIDRAALRPLLRRQIDRDLPMPAAEFFAVMRALQLIGDEPDVLDQLLDLYESQVLAFYDPLAHKYFKINNPAGSVSVPGFEQIVAVHELTHALQDQHFDAGSRMVKVLDDWDAQLAYRAVLEGEASLVMIAALQQNLGSTLDQLVESGGLDDAIELVASADGGEGEAPPYFIEEMKFPYVAGIRFVAEIYRRGGWKLVDKLHSAPPVSTEQVLDPDLYLSDSVGMSRLPSDKTSKDRMLTTSLGVFHWRFLLGETAASGWAGDLVSVTRKGKGYGVEIQTLWDEPGQARAFAKSLTELLSSRGIKSDVKIQGLHVRIAYAASNAQRVARETGIKPEMKILKVPSTEVPARTP